MRQDRNILRPLSARSIVASTLLGCHPPELPTRALVQMGTLYGIPEGTLRVALSRMLSVAPG
jgi:phenylacetic acid degradation operon negative regulatory protein